MKQRKIVIYTVGVAFSLSLFVACSDLRKLEKGEVAPIDANLPASTTQVVEEPPADSVIAPKLITFVAADGTEQIIMPTETDATTGEEIMSVAIDMIVIKERSRRNLVERNGLISVDFVVSVPEMLLDNRWQLVINPVIGKGPDTLDLDPLVYRGEKFERWQLKRYDKYNDYIGQIVDSTEYFEAFGRKAKYAKYLEYLNSESSKYTKLATTLDELSPEEAMTNKEVGWMSKSEFNGIYNEQRSYIKSTDRDVRRNTKYTINEDDKFDHLNDYLTPQYLYDEDDDLLGGEIYARVDGRYVDTLDQAEAEYRRYVVNSKSSVIRENLREADYAKIRKMAEDRISYTKSSDDVIESLLLSSDSAIMHNYNTRKQYASERIEDISEIDTNLVKQGLLREGKVKHNEELLSQKDEVYERIVTQPFFTDARVDTVIHNPNGTVDYYYTEMVQADENTSKLLLSIAGEVSDRQGNTYTVPRSDTLTYNVSSMTAFLDETPRYMQRIVLRDAEANARFYFTFKSGKTDLDQSLPENIEQIAAVRKLTDELMTDPVYIIDSITLRATSSPEGSWAMNDRLARQRASTLKRILDAEFKIMYDSLKVAASYTLDEDGNQVFVDASETLPDLPNLLRSTYIAEDWRLLGEMIIADDSLQGKDEFLAAIDMSLSPDAREQKLRREHPKTYRYVRKNIYPQMRAVDFRFNLHRRGMQQDTIYTTEVDSAYMNALDLIKKRRYEEALTTLRDYDDRNTALAYMSLGYNQAAYRIFKQVPNGSSIADIQYMLAILASRLGDEESAVKYFLRAVELRSNLKFRGNLDPEISRLVEKYGLFKEDFM